MKILIVDNGSKYLESLKALVSAHVVTVKQYTAISSTDNSSFDLIILSGGHKFSVIGHEDIFTNELELIKRTKTPVLGICLGFELIAHAFNSSLDRLSVKEKGLIDLTKIEDDPVFENIDSIQVFESHRWVVKEVGGEVVPLAYSRDGIEVIKHKTKLIYGFQFHPEMFNDDTAGDEIFANFINIVQNKAV